VIFDIFVFVLLKKEKKEVTEEVKSKFGKFVVDSY
jgi:hypothetical protein